MWYAFVMEISQEQKTTIATIAKQFRLRLLLLFGSQATGLTHAKSDVDIAVLAERPLDELDIRDALNEALMRVFRRSDVELVDLRRAPPLLQRDATAEGRLLFEEKPGVYDRFQLFAMKHFMETKPLRDLRRARLREFLAQ